METKNSRLCDYCEIDYHERCTLIFLPNRSDLCGCDCYYATMVARRDAKYADIKTDSTIGATD